MKRVLVESGRYVNPDGCCIMIAPAWFPRTVLEIEDEGETCSDPRDVRDKKEKCG